MNYLVIFYIYMRRRNGVHKLTYIVGTSILVCNIYFKIPILKKYRYSKLNIDCRKYFLNTSFEYSNFIPD